MGKTIFITEKPSVAQEYRKVLKVSSSERTDGYIEGHSGVLNRDGVNLPTGAAARRMGRNLEKGKPADDTRAFQVCTS